MPKLRKWQEAYLKEISEMSNPDLFDRVIDLSLWGYENWTMRERWMFSKTHIELIKRLCDSGFFRNYKRRRRKSEFGLTKEDLLMCKAAYSVLNEPEGA